MTTSLYLNPRYARTDLSVSASTIRNIPLINHSPTTTPPAVIKLDMAMTSDTQNVDAQNKSECVIQCQISASYTVLPERIGLDGIIVLDNRLCGRKLALALEIAINLVEATVSSDRLGLVAGEVVVSELIMCTLPYKVALQKSIRGVRGVEEGDLCEGIRIAGQLLVKEARNGGHVFFISDGQFLGDQTTMSSIVARTTVHVIAIGALVNETVLRNIRGQRGVYVEFREGRKFDVDEFLRYLGGIYEQGIETVRCRLDHPEEVSVTSVFPQSLSLDSTLSLTLRKSPSLNSPISRNPFAVISASLYSYSLPFSCSLVHVQPSFHVFYCQSVC